mgnify:CR=1 FL=1
MNVLLAAVHHAVTLTIVKFAALNNISHVAKLVVLTHAHPSAHVNTIDPVAFAATYVFVGVHHVQFGFVLSSLYTPLNNLEFHATSYAHAYKYLVHSVLSVILVQLVYAVPPAQHCANVAFATHVQ